MSIYGLYQLLQLLLYVCRIVSSWEKLGMGPRLPKMQNDAQLGSRHRLLREKVTTMADIGLRCKQPSKRVPYLNCYFIPERDFVIFGAGKLSIIL